MSINHKKIEEIEYKYLKEIEWNLTNEKDKLLKLLQTKDSIRDDWESKFDSSKKKSSDLARGSERVFASLFPNSWRPNSSPIGSDLMFETVDSIIHIDIKTTSYSNKSDHKGKINVGENQISYYVKKSDINGNLPAIYTIKREGRDDEKKVCISFIAQVIYKKESHEIICVVLACIPNKELYEYYGDEIMDKGKGKGSSVRYRYGDQIFKLLKDKSEDKKRFSIVYKNPDFEKEVNSITKLAK